MYVTKNILHVCACAFSCTRATHKSDKHIPAKTLAAQTNHVTAKPNASFLTRLSLLSVYKSWCSKLLDCHYFLH